MGSGDEAFAAASPFLKMPALRDPGADGGRDFTISDSSAIVTYMEARVSRSEPDPARSDSARARHLVGRIRRHDASESLRAGVLQSDRPATFPEATRRSGGGGCGSTRRLAAVVRYLERSIPASDFLVEDRLTLADIAVVSPMVNLDHGGAAIDAARWPRTVAYRDGLLSRPGVTDLVAAERRMLAA